MKILLDENVDNRIESILENLDFEVSTTYKESLTSQNDSEILKYCRENDFAVLTHDDDFLKIKNSRQKEAGVIFLPQRIRFREMKNRVKQLKNQDLQGTIYL